MEIQRLRLKEALSLEVGLISARSVGDGGHEEVILYESPGPDRSSVRVFTSTMREIRTQ